MTLSVNVSSHGGFPSKLLAWDALAAPDVGSGIIWSIFFFFQKKKAAGGIRGISRRQAQASKVEGRANGEVIL